MATDDTVIDKNDSCLMSPSLSQQQQKQNLPQSNIDSDKKYYYIGFDQINEVFFFPHLPKHTACRVMISKGKKNNRTQLIPDSVITLEDYDAEQSQKIIEENMSGTGEEKENTSKEHRIKSQYPSGSTYHIRRSNLVPILQPHHHKQKIVVLVPETVDYRRLCIVHTRPQDSFIEIGSDLGKTISKVVASRRLGIDKSSTSVQIASETYPDCPFLEEDVLIEGREWWQEFLVNHDFENNDETLVVGIDINGNREFEAVRECLERVLTWWKPRLVLVKARSMFQVFQESNCRS